MVQLLQQECESALELLQFLSQSDLNFILSFYTGLEIYNGSKAELQEEQMFFVHWQQYPSNR